MEPREKVRGYFLKRLAKAISYLDIHPECITEVQESFMRKVFASKLANRQERGSVKKHLKKIAKFKKGKK